MLSLQQLKSLTHKVVQENATRLPPQPTDAENLALEEKEKEPLSSNETWYSLDDLFIVELLDAYTFVASVRRNLDGVPAGTLLTLRADHTDSQMLQATCYLDADPSLYTAFFDPSAFDLVGSSGFVPDPTCKPHASNSTQQPKRRVLKFRDAKYEQLQREHEVVVSHERKPTEENSNNEMVPVPLSVVTIPYEQEQEQEEESASVFHDALKLKGVGTKRQPLKRKDAKPALNVNQVAPAQLVRVDPSEGAATLDWTRRCTMAGRVRVFELLSPEWITVFSTTLTSFLISTQDVYAFHVDASDQSFVVQHAPEERVHIRLKINHTYGHGYLVGTSLVKQKVIPGTTAPDTQSNEEYLLLRYTARQLGQATKERASYRKTTSQKEFERLLTPEWFSLLMHANRLIQSWVRDSLRETFSLFSNEKSTYEALRDSTHAKDRVVWSLMEGTEAKMLDATYDWHATYDWLVQMAKNSRSALLLNDATTFDVASFWACECVTSHDINEQFMHQRGCVLLPRQITSKKQLNTFYKKLDLVLTQLRATYRAEFSTIPHVLKDLTLQERLGDIIDSLYHRRMSASVAISDAERQKRLRRAHIRLSSAEHFFRAL